MFKFENEVDAKLAIYEACMNGEITEAQKDSLMMSLNKKLGKVLLEKIKSGMKFKYAGDTYIAKGSVTYQTVSGVKIPTLKVQKEDGTVTNLQFDPEEDKAVRLVKESAEDEVITEATSLDKYIPQIKSASNKCVKLCNEIINSNADDSFKDVAKSELESINKTIDKYITALDSEENKDNYSKIEISLVRCATRLRVSLTSLSKKCKDESISKIIDSGISELETLEDDVLNLDKK